MPGAAELLQEGVIIHPGQDEGLLAMTPAHRVPAAALLIIGLGRVRRVWKWIVMSDEEVQMFSAFA